MNSFHQEEWRTYLDLELVESMTRTAVGLAHNLRDPLILMNRIYESRRSTPGQRPLFADDMCSGSMPAALLFDHLDRTYPGQGFDAVAHAHLVTAMNNLQDPASPRSNMLGLHSGLAGACYIPYLCSRHMRRYTLLLEQLDTYFLERLAESIERFSTTSADPWRSFDVISGSSGIIRYLLARRDDHRFRAFLNTLVEGLVERSKHVNTVDGFYTPFEKLPSDRHRDLFPNGYVDCGMAHGLGGVLAALSLVRLAGESYPQLENSIKSISGWLIHHRLGSTSAANWPMGIDPTRADRNEATQLAWCYGTPGISIALLLGGQALGDASLREEAISSFKSISTQKEALSHIKRRSILCHGVAGLLQIAFRFLQLTRDDEILQFASTLSTKLVNAYQSGNKDHSSSEWSDWSGSAGDFLEGEIGVALVLASARPGPIPVWDQTMMIA